MSRTLIRNYSIRLQYDFHLTTPRIQNSKPHRMVLYQTHRGMRLYKERLVRGMYWRSRSFDAIKLPQGTRDTWIEWNYKSEIFAFSKRLQEDLQEQTLRQIFTHKSYLDKLRKEESKLDLASINIESNDSFIERGQMLLDSCLKPYLRYTFDQVPEEGIVEMAGYLQSETVLADIAKWIGCKDIILSSERPASENTMAKTVFALLSGIEKDSGLPRVRRFVVDIIASYLNDKDLLDDVWSIPNPKETLNYILENNKLPLYEPRIMFQTGVRTLEACHIIGIYVNKKLIGSSAGETIPIAEDCAALESLRNLFGLTDHRKPFVYGEKSETIDYKAHVEEHVDLKNWKLRLD